MSIDSASAAGGAVAARIAAIQQMAQQLGMGASGGTTAGVTDFTSALNSAQDASATTNVSSVSTPVSGTPYASEINAAATKYGIDPSLLAGLVKQESGFNPNATSSVGAKGLTQLMPATARSLGVTDTSDPVQSLDGGAKYLRQQLDRFGGDVTKAVAAYNAGPGAVQRYGGVPPYAETQNYVKTVLANRDAYAKTAAANGTIATGTETGSTAATVNALSNLTGVSATGGTTLSNLTNPLSSSLDALSTDDAANSSNLSLSSSSSSAGSRTSSSLGYPTT